MLEERESGACWPLGRGNLAQQNVECGMRNKMARSSQGANLGSATADGLRAMDDGKCMDDAQRQIGRYDFEEEYLGIGWVVKRGRESTAERNERGPESKPEVEVEFEDERQIDA